MGYLDQCELGRTMGPPGPCKGPAVTHNGWTDIYESSPMCTTKVKKVILYTNTRHNKASITSTAPS